MWLQHISQVLNFPRNGTFWHAQIRRFEIASSFQSGQMCYEFVEWASFKGNEWGDSKYSSSDTRLSSKN